MQCRNNSSNHSSSMAALRVCQVQAQAPSGSRLQPPWQVHHVLLWEARQLAEPVHLAALVPLVLHEPLPAAPAHDMAGVQRHRAVHQVMARYYLLLRFASQRRVVVLMQLQHMLLGLCRPTQGEPAPPLLLRLLLARPQCQASSSNSRLLPPATAVSRLSLLAHSISISTSTRRRLPHCKSATAVWV